MLQLTKKNFGHKQVFSGFFSLEKKREKAGISPSIKKAISIVRKNKFS